MKGWLFLLLEIIVYCIVLCDATLFVAFCIDCGFLLVKRNSKVLVKYSIIVSYFNVSLLRKS